MNAPILLALIIVAGCERAPPKPPQTAQAQGAARIDLDLDGVDMHDAFRALAKAAHMNFSLDPDVTGTVTIHVRSTPAEEVLDRIAHEHSLRVEALSNKVLRVSNASTPPAPHREYTGKPMTAAFDDTPIRTVAKAFAELAGVEIVVDDDVQAAVTEHMGGVAWDLALDHIARKYSLHIVWTGDRIRIANGP